MDDRLREAFELWEEMSLDEGEWYAYESRFKAMKDEISSKVYFELKEKKALEKGLQKGLEQGLQKGLEQGLEQGMEQGIEQGKIEMRNQLVRGMLLSDFEMQMICELTGLSEKEVEEIKKNMNEFKS